MTHDGRRDVLQLGLRGEAVCLLLFRRLGSAHCVVARGSKGDVDAAETVEDGDDAQLERRDRLLFLHQEQEEGDEPGEALRVIRLSA